MRSGHSLRAEMRQAAHRIQAARQARIRREREEAFASLPGDVSQETLDAIASCESGGNPTAISSDGSYRGKYQFDSGTWESVGGSGDPAAASEEEQDYRAALLYAQSGSSPWPICG
jgi:Transglycosylase-like domain